MLAAALVRFFDKHAAAFAPTASGTSSAAASSTGRRDDGDGRTSHAAIDAVAVRASRSVRDFDERVIVPMFGYAGAWHQRTDGEGMCSGCDQRRRYYYEDSKSSDRIHEIRTPTLLLHARDDPIVSINAMLGALPAVSESSCVLAAITPEGGHVAWATGVWPGPSWECGVIAEFIGVLQARRRHVQAVGHGAATTAVGNATTMSRGSQAAATPALVSGSIVPPQEDDDDEGGLPALRIEA